MTTHKCAVRRVGVVRLLDLRVQMWEATCACSAYRTFPTWHTAMAAVAYHQAKGARVL